MEDKNKNIVEKILNGINEEIASDIDLSIQCNVITIGANDQRLNELKEAERNAYNEYVAFENSCKREYDGKCWRIKFKGDQRKVNSLERKFNKAREKWRSEVKKYVKTL